MVNLSFGCVDNFRAAELSTRVTFNLLHKDTTTFIISQKNLWFFFILLFCENLPFVGTSCIDYMDNATFQKLRQTLAHNWELDAEFSI